MAVLAHRRPLSGFYREWGRRGREEGDERKGSFYFVRPGFPVVGGQPCRVLVQRRADSRAGDAGTILGTVSDAQVARSMAPP